MTTTRCNASFSFHEEQELARGICRRCPEIRACLIWALTHREQGIWAGTDEDQREELLARHTRSAS